MIDLIIDANDIRNYKDISMHTPDSRINEYIRDAQEQDLRLLLGNSFYFDVLSNLANPVYSDLLNGGDFQKDSCTWTQQGLKAVLVEFTWGRYTYFGIHNDTPFGNTVKLSDFSKESESKDRKDIWEQSKQRANSYFDVIRTYLCDAAFDVWDNGCDCTNIKGRHLRNECTVSKSNGFNYSLIK